MKNLDKIKNKFTMWQSIDNFLSFTELYNLSLQYYHQALVYCFATEDKEIYIIRFDYDKHKNVFNLKYGYFTDIYTYNNVANFKHLEFEDFPLFIKKYNFKKNLKRIFSLFEVPILYYCHISKVYDLVKESINC